MDLLEPSATGSSAPRKAKADPCPSQIQVSEPPSLAWHAELALVFVPSPSSSDGRLQGGPSGQRVGNIRSVGFNHFWELASLGVRSDGFPTWLQLLGHCSASALSLPDHV